MRAAGGGWVQFAEDKVGMAALLDGYGFDAPRAQADDHAWRLAPRARSLRDADEIAGFLRDGADYPLLCKPMGSQMSLGTALVGAYDADEDQLHFPGDRYLDVDEFVAQITAMDSLDDVDLSMMQPKAGYLFQSCLVPHPAMVEILATP